MYVYIYVCFPWIIKLSNGDNIYIYTHKYVYIYIIMCSSPNIQTCFRVMVCININL